MRVVNYGEESVPAVAAFNARIQKNFPGLKFPEASVSVSLPKLPGRELYQEYYVALDDGGAVRGAYILKHQAFFIKGRVVSIADWQLPISEGICDTKYRYLGASLLYDALKKQPLLYGLGMGGMGEPLPRMLKGAGWSFYPVPFFFRINSAFNFLRNIAFLRRRPARRLALDFLAFSGLGWLGNSLAHAVLSKSASGKTLCENFESFQEWADELWEDSKASYGLCAVRDAKTLNILYPSADRRFIKIRVFNGGRLLGWAVMLDTRMERHKQFGAMRVGSIVDCMARPEDAGEVMAAAADVLLGRGTDIIVSNQLHHAWGKALKRAGFLSGPTNFLFAVSKPLASLLQPVDAGQIDMHMNRGDGDGPINL
ncbi:MAG: hypothetical protein GX410_04085 [Elusimicrobia bacterium]|nr:hypothetical protein [Elusimicrobiota bacterium]